MTVVADKQIEFRGLRLDGSYEIQSIEGLADAAEIRSSDKARVVRHGLAAGFDYLGGRSVVLTVAIYSFSSATFRSAVADFREAFAASGGSTEYPLTFQFPGIADGVTALINCRARKLSLPMDSTYWADMATATVELFATDPLIYSAAEATTTLALGVSSGGLTFPLTFPMTFGASGNSGLTTVTNAGSAPSAPTFRIYGPVTNPSLRNETLDREISVGIVLGSGEFLDIDVASRSVLLGGAASRYSSLTAAEWWELQPGGNQIRYTAASGTGVTVDLTWRSAWY